MEYRNGSIMDIYRLAVMWAATAMETLFGGTDGLFLTLIVFMSADYITGVCSAVVSKNLSSRIGARGLAKKMGILCIVSLATMIERNILDTTALRSAVILYYISNEGISIFENLAKMGVPIPKKLKEILSNMSSEEE